MMLKRKIKIFLSMIKFYDFLNRNDHLILLLKKMIILYTIFSSSLFPPLFSYRESRKHNNSSVQKYPLLVHLKNHYENKGSVN